MKSALLVAAVAACGPGLKGVTPEEQRDHTRETAAAFAASAQAGDVASVRKLFGPSVMNGGVWFADPTCEAEFAAPGDVGGGRLDELARCLTLAKVALSPRKDALPDVVVLTYAPGIELEARFADNRGGRALTWLGYVARHDTTDALPTISPDTLEALRIAGTREPAVAGLETQAHAWVKLCIDGEGNVTGTHVREATSHKAARLLVEAIHDWKFKPFAPAGQPLPVCSMVVLGSPLATVLEKTRIPLPFRADALVVPAMAMKLIAGSKMITPDDDTKFAIQQAGISRITGSFALCIDATGTPNDLRMLMSTGIPAYDRRILATIPHWRYTPFIDDGQPAPVCTAITFIYTQR